MKSTEIKRKMSEEGYIRAIVVFEVVGNPKEYVETALKKHIEKLKLDPNIHIIKEDIESPEQQEQFWSTFAEIELLIKNLEKFTWMCMNFMPASIEILEPDSLTFKGRELTNWLNDLLAKMHEIALVSQQVGQQSKAMLKNINAIVRNAILICVDAKITNVNEISKKIGVAKKDLEAVFDAMIKEGTIKKKGKGYTRK
ncbi:MAG: hypothetical protein ABIB43_05515 [archaeon]